MDGWGLVTAAALMGLAGMPHCAAMCSAPCQAALRGCGPARTAQWTFHLSRVAGYAGAGLVGAASVGALRELLSWAPWLRPLWTLAHLGAMALGLWMLVRGQLPAWLSRGPQALTASTSGEAPVRWHPARAAARAGFIGSVWIAWPCGLSQSALLLAALADQPLAGAAAMGAFAMASSPGLMVAAVVPALARLRGGSSPAARAARWPVRLAGAALAGASGWALTHGLWQRVAEWCVS